MPQTTTIKFIVRRRRHLSRDVIDHLVRFLEVTPNKRVFIMSTWRDKDDHEEMPFKEVKKFLFKWSKVALVQTQPIISPRIASYMDSLRSEGRFTHKPENFWGETSLRLGRDRIIGADVKGEELPRIHAYLVLSMYGESTPENWQAFEDDLFVAEATKTLLRELREICPDFEMLVSYGI